MSPRLVGVALAVLLAGCPARRDAALDASLPDGAAVEAVAPSAALEAFSANADPVLRATALAAYVRELPSPDVDRWIVQGTYDPDPWVQERVAEALFARGDDVGRAALIEVAQRGSADPYVRARIAHRLLDAGQADALGGLRSGWADRGRTDDRAAPLALVAARLGVPEARAFVERAVGGSELRDDPTFLVDLGRFGWPGLVPALTKAQETVEEEAAWRLELPKALLGDAAGKAAWARAVRSRDLGRDALDLVRALPADVADPWLKALAASPDAGVKLAVAALRDPSTVTVGRALASKDAYARALGARLAASLKPADAEPLLRRALVDEEPDVRAAAAEAVADLRLVALADALQPLAVDDRSPVRAAGQAARWRLERSAR